MALTPLAVSLFDVVTATLPASQGDVSLSYVHGLGKATGRTVGRVLTGPELPEFDFGLLALGLAAVSFGLIGVLMAGAAFFGEQAERAKRTWLPTTIQGLVLVGISAFIIGILAPNFED
jgi:hypothetical protein